MLHVFQVTPAGRALVSDHDDADAAELAAEQCRRHFPHTGFVVVADVRLPDAPLELGRPADRTVPARRKQIARRKTATRRR